MMVSNPLDLTGRRYLITGAASGIGKATCILLSRLGAELLLVDINLDGLQVTQQLCNNRTFLLSIDLTDTELMRQNICEAVMDFGTLNGFAHIAGRPYITPLKGVSEKVCTEVYKLNAYAAIELAKLFTNRRIYAGKNGSVVLISSVYGVVGSAANVGYAMSKSAIIGITKALAMEFASKNIRFNCIAPGFIRTPMMDANINSFDQNYLDTLNRLHPLGLGEADDIANAVAYLFSDMAKWVTGSVMHVDGGFTAQ
ncbi:SDR family NAD(P)-dependent oxidoreductase [Parabacteroides goldsteinii]|jgi:NAD(P)-dependent dehydrogenase (short-subunit alcohol dehydrogenase family)|uniref:SDR family NAD(P)-dependent oxidoreductase n=1 Tax=Parabacteroides goldsteinii TaxID=328812 RepID=UPI001CCA8D86|nr:SDR family NAD(P)-dependent oxidoreductase [Parabacteroides goldsteinii]